MRYLDAALVVTAYCTEPDTDRVQRWLARHAEDGFAISAWVKTEVASATAAKLRAGALDHALRREALDGFALLARSSTWLPIEPERFEDATRLCDATASGLRAGDALHLAIARAHGAALCTLDRAFARGCELLGHPVELI